MPLGPTLDSAPQPYLTSQSSERKPQSLKSGFWVQCSIVMQGLRNTALIILFGSGALRV